jgi:hypothetical protein
LLQLLLVAQLEPLTAPIAPSLVQLLLLEQPAFSPLTAPIAPSFVHAFSLQLLPHSFFAPIAPILAAQASLLAHLPQQPLVVPMLPLLVFAQPDNAMMPTARPATRPKLSLRMRKLLIECCETDYRPGDRPGCSISVYAQSHQFVFTFWRFLLNTNAPAIQDTTLANLDYPIAKKNGPGIAQAVLSSVHINSDDQSLIINP